MIHITSGGYRWVGWADAKSGVMTWRAIGLDFI
jgi:hypothetical protein